MRRAQAALRDLAHSCAHYTFLADIIEKLQCLGATLTWSVGLILDFQERFVTIPNGPIADIVSSKLKSVSDKRTVLTGEHSAISEGIGSLNVPKYKYVR